MEIVKYKGVLMTGAKAKKLAEKEGKKKKEVVIPKEEPKEKTTK